MKSLVALVVVVASASAEASRPGSSAWTVGFGYSGACTTVSTSTLALPDLPSSYYGIEMVPTKRVPGTGAGRGVGIVTFSRSPYGVSVSSDGTYRVDVRLVLDKLKPPKKGTLTAWATKDDLSEVTRLGALDESFRASGQVDWSKFLLVVTLEPTSNPSEAASDRWRGPVVMRGMSRSGLMHTLAGHGPYEKEPCAKYGF
jgi:hypothetical protein